MNSWIKAILIFIGIVITCIGFIYLLKYPIFVKIFLVLCTLAVSLGVIFMIKTFLDSGL